MGAADWLGRRIAVCFDGERMFVSTRREVAAFDLPTGRRIWSQRPAGRSADGDGESAVPGFAPMWPVAAGGRVLVRAIGEDGPELACLDASGGSVLWVAGVSGYVAADPMLLGEELFVLVARPQTAKLVLLLTALDGRTGAVLRETPLAEFRDGPAGVLECQAAAGEGRIVVTVAGCVLCCDTQGRLDWIRRQMYVPPPSPSPHRGPRSAIPWDDRRPAPPHVFDGRVYATQPGVWSVECIDLWTGRLAWRKAVPEIVELLGVCDGRLILRTWDTIVGMDLGSGERQWLHPIGLSRAAACLREGAGVVACAGVAQPNDAPPEDAPVLVELDAGTGVKRSTAGIHGAASLGQAGALLGPLVGRGDRFWLFTGQEDHPERCEVVELVP
jgi:outer membrane protein assembly factor BamB